MSSPVVQCLKLKSNIICYLDVWRDQRAKGVLEYSNHEFYSHPTEGKFPKPNHLPYHQTDQVWLLHIPDSKFQFPDNPQSYSNKLITFSQGNRGCLTLLILQSLFPIAPGCPLCSWAQRLYGPWGVWYLFSLPLGCEYMWLISCSYPICSVLGAVCWAS